MDWYHDYFGGDAIEHFSRSLRSDDEDLDAVVAQCSVFAVGRAVRYLRRPPAVLDLEIVASAWCWWPWKPEQAAAYVEAARLSRSEFRGIRADSLADAVDVFDGVPPGSVPRFLSLPTDAVIALLSANSVLDHYRQAFRVLVAGAGPIPLLLDPMLPS